MIDTIVTQIDEVLAELDEQLEHLLEGAATLDHIADQAEATC